MSNSNNPVIEVPTSQHGNFGHSETSASILGYNSSAYKITSQSIPVPDHDPNSIPALFYSQLHRGADLGPVAS